MSVAFISVTILVDDARLKKPEFPERYVYVVVELFIAEASTHLGETNTSIVPAVDDV